LFVHPERPVWLGFSMPSSTDFWSDQNEADTRDGASTPSPSERHNSSLLWVTGGLPIGSEKASSRSSIRPLRYSGITRMVAVPGTGPGIGAGDGAAPWTGAGWNAAAGWEGCLTAASCDGAGAGGVASTGGASIAGTSLACAGGNASSTGAGVALGFTGGVAAETFAGICNSHFRFFRRNKRMLM
jgi:hypothetical protein